ncbi:response regulator [Mucilaginibacter sp.]|uniref:response regulator transcription factor n=1 Tax=Mucilaginibacter sp. TaxID=1882438 RepID=UPI0025F55EC4|nr:response regulator [Mucilaginibacter sp.]
MKKILLIEDNDDIRENTCELLELEGYEVVAATDGRAGMLLAQECLPDIILCDIMMPQADGYEVFRELKAIPSTAAIPFIFLTANSENTEMEAAMRLGADGYIRKPFSPEELLEVLGRCCLLADKH